MNTSIALTLARSARRRPDHPALVYNGSTVSYARLWDEALTYATALRAVGIGPGDRVGLLLPNTPAFPVLYYATLALGAVVVPVHALSKPPEIAHILRDARARALVCDSSLRHSGADGAATAGARLLVLPEPGGPADWGGDRRVRLDEAVHRSSGDLAVVLYTSGTTGASKGVMLTHGSVTANIATTAVSPFAFGEKDVLLGCLPLSHTFGQICGMGVCFHTGATLVLMDRFAGPEAYEQLVVQGCTVLMGVPTMLLALLEAAAGDPRRPRLDRVFSGGAALPAPVLEQFEQVFGCPVYEGYGLTETSPVVSYNTPDRPRRAGTVGVAIEGVRVGIADPRSTDRVRLLAPAEIGEVVVRGHGLMAGYLHDPQATARVMQDGWLRTGDLGVTDAEGCLTLVDRLKDVVVRGGYNVYPREVEYVLLCHPAVAQAAVFGTPHPSLGEEVRAAVTLHPGRGPDTALEEELAQWARARLTAYKCPRSVRILDELPLGAGGKVLKRQLRSAWVELSQQRGTSPR